MSTPSSLFFPQTACQFWTLHLISASYWACPNYSYSVFAITGHWLLIVNIIKELELGREGIFDMWAGFEKFWSRSVTILLAWRPNLHWLAVLWSQERAYRLPWSCTHLGHRLRQMRQSAATCSGSWTADERGNDSILSQLKLPGNLGIT